MKKLLFALSIVGMFMLIGCNPCRVGDCTCIMWTFDNDTSETITVKNIKHGDPSSITIAPYAFVEVYVESDADYVSFDYTPDTVLVKKIAGSYTYRFYK